MSTVNGQQLVTQRQGSLCFAQANSSLHPDSFAPTTIATLHSAQRRLSRPGYDKANLKRIACKSSFRPPSKCPLAVLPIVQRHTEVNLYGSTAHCRHTCSLPSKVLLPMIRRSFCRAKSKAGVVTSGATKHMSESPSQKSTS
jgi:hypothetical protein